MSIPIHARLVAAKTQLKQIPPSLSSLHLINTPGQKPLHLRRTRSSSASLTLRAKNCLGSLNQFLGDLNLEAYIMYNVW